MTTPTAHQQGDLTIMPRLSHAAAALNRMLRSNRHASNRGRLAADLTAITTAPASAPPLVVPIRLGVGAAGTYEVAAAYVPAGASSREVRATVAAALRTLADHLTGVVIDTDEEADHR